MFILGQTAGRSGRARSARPRLDGLLVLGTLSAVALGAFACRSLRPVRIDPTPPEASALFARAQALLRQVESLRAPEREEARELARQAAAADPAWVAPERLQDEMLREELRAVDALVARRARVAHGRGGQGGENADPREAARYEYLTGRLEGAGGEARFARAADLDPSLAWARHGLAWSADRRGEERAAVGHARAALSRARDPWERSFFTLSLARFLSKAGRRDEARAVLAERLAEKDTYPADRIAISVESVAIALDDEDSAEALPAYRNGLELLRETDLTAEEVESLVGRIRPLATRKDGGLLELSTALGSRRSVARDRLRAEVMLALGPTPLALGLLQRSLAGERRREVSGPLLRAAQFAAGEFAPAVEIWLESLPVRLRDREGLPHDPRLARVVRCARAVAGKVPGGAEDTPAWLDFGEALLAAGWFREARALSGPLARADFDRALDQEGRAAAGIELLTALDDLVRRVGKRGGGQPASASAAGDRGPDAQEMRRLTGLSDPAAGVRDLTGLLAAMGRVFARSRVPLSVSAGGSAPGREVHGREESDLARAFAASPRLDYGPVGEVVHPGPLFSKTDEQDGLGTAGAPVPGVAQAMEAIGRFALFGELSGAGGPDGTVLARVWAEEKSGQHFGVPWSGVVVWCEGADVRSRAERQGARISAAALHEGFWLDVDSVRGERNAYLALASEFSGEGAAERVEQALQGSGLPLEQRHEEARRRERRRTGAVLGEASRMRLAILRDRAPAGRLLGEMTLDELVEVTATHEEGHLVDRTRYLPLSRNWGKALLFLLDCGLSPLRVAERLEYRAELAALAGAPDPRVPLAQVLDAAETETRGVTPHAGGYADLLEDLLEVLGGGVAEDPGDYPWIDADRTLVHQLHRLPPETVRALSMELAEKLGLVR